MILHARVEIFNLVLVVYQNRNRADKRLAVAEYIHPWIAVLVELQPVMALHPARDALVVALCEIHAVPCRCLLDALAAARVPDCRVCNACDILSLEPWVLPLDLRDLLELLVRCPLHALVRRLRAAV